MNVNMWEHPATQNNMKTLRERGVHVVEPDAGYLACGMLGPGRLAANEAIVAATLEALGAAQDLAGETVLITAGPTREPVDPVRYLGNRSSGKMGYALAEAALRRGARVILVSGPTSLQPPGAAETIPVQTAEEMRKAVLARFLDASVVIKAAAVADYRPKEAAGQKIKRKNNEKLVLELEPTADILAELGKKKTTQILVGFAAETEDALRNAKRKLEAKSADAIVVNDVSQPGIGFDSDRNAVTIVTPSGTIEVPESTKWEVAHRVLDAVVRIRQERSHAVAPMSSGRRKA
jgi:phosphopantothenoylcysteine decarboxylase/phosphopantothenate--cysteine ligase